MKNIGQHIVEYYQNNKYLGSVVCSDVLPDNQIGYINQVKIYDGEVKFKKKHKASIEQPFITIRYNLQGR